MSSSKHHIGFTIIELLIVIVVIAVLATISVVAYSGIQDRARYSKVQSDIALLVKAVTMARENESKTLAQISGSAGTAAECAWKSSGTDLGTLPISDGCWVSYNLFLDRLSNASGVDVRGLTDPWSRPYLVDENEGVGGICYKDTIAMFTIPFQTGWSVHSWTWSRNVNYSGFSHCS